MTRPAPSRYELAARIAAGVWAATMVFGLAVGALGSASTQRAIVSDGPPCPLKTVTGIDCPFCGMTHATVALGRGDWSGALHAHPLAPLVLGGMLVLMAMIVVGRSDAVMRGRRIYVLLGAIAAIWLLRLVL
jgi:hypothetical protein|nr:DUF2752 domain-containing protein [Kofleriaceae bacterium]